MEAHLLGCAGDASNERPFDHWCSHWGSCGGFLGVLPLDIMLLLSDCRADSSWICLVLHIIMPVLGIHLTRCRKSAR